MNRITQWFASLAGKLTAIALVIIVGNLMLLGVNISTLNTIETIPDTLDQLGAGRTYAAEIAIGLQQLTDENPQYRRDGRVALRELISAVDHRFEVLLNGDPVQGMPPISNQQSQQQIRDNQQHWQRETLPLIEEVLMETDPASLRPRLNALRAPLTVMAGNTAQTIGEERENMQARITRSKWLQLSFGVVLLVILLIAALIMRSVLRTLSESISTLASVTAEMLAGTSQQAASAQEQAAAVAETVSTVDEVVQTSEQAAQRAKQVADSAQQVAVISKAGLDAIETAIANMDNVNDYTESAARNILSLAERAQSIGEIIAAVNEVAEQTNLLALNAGIEAARAGEHGSGFSVVAREIKDLASQAKQATQQVRQILGEIQKSTNSAVMVTEEGSKSVTATLRFINQAGDAIHTLSNTVDQAAIAASQISASTSQQTIGMGQIRQAMRDINEATSQTSAATRQSEGAARDLNNLGLRLKALLGA